VLTTLGTASPHRDEPPPAASFRVAVADDDPVSRLLLKKRLVRIGILDVTLFNNGAHLLEELGHHPYHLVFLDIAMPGADGYTVAHNLRNHPDWSLNREVFLAATTAEEPFSCIPRCRSNGIDWFISKPITESILRSVCGRSGFDPEATARPTWDPVYFHCPISHRARHA